MKLTKAAAMLALATGLAGVSSAFASPPDERALWEMLQASAAARTDRMVTKTDTMKNTEQDKGGKGALGADEIARILDPNIANP